MDPREYFDTPKFEKNSENFEKSRKSRNLAREIFTITPGEVKFSSIFTSGGVFFRNFHLAGVFFSEIFTSGGVFSEKWPKITQPRAREITQPLSIWSKIQWPGQSVTGGYSSGFPKIFGKQEKCRLVV